jgi:uncharacterized protein YdhG (YjbR/CyaY superfamily)
MKGKTPSTIAEYIAAAPMIGQPNLHKLYAILKSVVPDAQETIKWGCPYFIEPRFLFAFSAHKAHLSFAPSIQTLEVFRKELEKYNTTKHFLKISYTDSVPEDLIRKIAEYQLKTVRGREDDSFW